MGAAVCRGGYGAPLAFSTSAFARWFAVRLVQAFVWLHAHIGPMHMLTCSSAAAASPAGVPRDVGSCARVGAYGCRGLARGRAPAGSGRFRRKWMPVSPWVWASVRFPAGVVRCRLCRPGEMPARCGVSGRFGLRNRPEVASGVCLRWKLRILACV